MGEKKRPGSRNRFNSKAGKKSQEESIPRQEDFKGLIQRVGARSGGRREDFLAKKGERRRRKKQVAAPLSAGDLWSLNRSTKNFAEFRERGRRGRKASQPKSWRKQRGF